MTNRYAAVVGVEASSVAWRVARLQLRKVLKREGGTHLIYHLPYLSQHPLQYTLMVSGRLTKTNVLDDL